VRSFVQMASLETSFHHGDELELPPPLLLVNDMADDGDLFPGLADQASTPPSTLHACSHPNPIHAPFRAPILGHELPPQPTFAS